MHPALIQLTLFRFRGSLRRFVRSLKTVRGVIFALIGLMFLGWIGFVASMGFTNPLPIDLTTRRAVAPAAVLALFVLTLLNPNVELALAFNMAEVDFLFAGPFTRRALIVYRLVLAMLGGTLFAIFLWLFLISWFPSGFAGFLGIWLTLVFFHLLSVIIGLASHAFGERLLAQTRFLTLALLLAPVAFGVWEATHGIAASSFLELLTRFRESLGGRIALAPFQLFANVMLVDSIGSKFLAWTGLAACLNLLLFGCVLRLDALFLEATLRQSQKRYDRIQRMRQGQTAVKPMRSARLGVRDFPWLGGFGPVAWRQTLELARRSSKSLAIATALLVVFGMFLFERVENGRMVAPMLPALVIWSSVVLIESVHSGLRVNIHFIERLKTLPIRPAALVAGELVPSICFLTATQAMLIGAVMIVHPIPLAQALALLAAAFAINVFLVAIDSLLFLLQPYSMGEGASADLASITRRFMSVFLRFVAIAVALGIAAAVAGAGWLLGVRAVAPLLVIGWTIFMFEALAVAACVAVAFDRFDPSLDMPA